MTTITATIITQDEAADIAACIESVLWMDEIIILDAKSTDGTQDICRKYDKVKLIETDWPGFGKQKNRALELATSDWIFSIDADERITPELKAEIIKTINATNNDYVAYKIPRLNYFSGKVLYHCANKKGDNPIRLIKKNCGNFNDAAVHESIIVNGKTGLLKNHLLHFSYKNLEELITKINSYSTLGAETLSATKAQPHIIKIFGHAFWSFIKIYFIKLGFLDGWPGFLFAFSNFESTFYRYAKLREKQRNIYES